jgi:SWI/SNF-related matrix-associated actin-dependent regulator 1 of chromatin subfamily A
MATRRSEEILARGFQAAIADEVHYLKSRDAKRSINLIPIISKAKRVILISGTPMLARPMELYNILNILRPDVFN